MKYLERKVSPEKMKRRLMLIDALREQIYHFDDGTRDPRNYFDRYPHWKTDYSHYKMMSWAARQILKRGFRYKTEYVGKGGIAGSQTITVGGIEIRRQIDYHKILQKAVDIAYEREQRQAPSKEEISSMLEKPKTRWGRRRVLRKIKSRLPRPRYKIERDLFQKIQNYRDRKTGAI